MTFLSNMQNSCFTIMRLMWSITLPAVRSSMPDFYEKMKNKLRTVDEGADTIVWLAISEAAIKQPSGLFFQGTAMNIEVCMEYSK